MGHEKPASAYGDSIDPGPDDTGRAQALRAAEQLKALRTPEAGTGGEGGLLGR